MDPAEYCREVEAYLCRKNDGHLVRIVGPSFERVNGWSEQGVPLKIVCGGIDRYFERYYAKGPRRRPVRIDFCEADILDLFDEWRRAVGIFERDRTPGPPPLADESEADRHDDAARPPSDRPRSRSSLAAHLDRLILRLTRLRASDRVASDFDAAVDRIVRELDRVRADSRAFRGHARSTLLDRLETMDRELAAEARRTCAPALLGTLAAQAEDELRPFKARMPVDAWRQAVEDGLDRLVRERVGLPTIVFNR
jgi:hypothetical protein